VAFVYADRVKEESTTTGLSPMVLNGALDGYQDFATGIGDGNDTYYTIFNSSDNTWEVGVGNYSAGSLTRSTVIASSNSGALVPFAAGTKVVFATVASQFFASALSPTSHSALNHAGIPGVPAPESFTSADHALVDHTIAPFGLLDSAGHDAVDHKSPPFNLLDEPAHDLLDHTGLPGVNAFDSTAHGLTNHSGIPGVPSPETFTAPVHAATDHTGIPGVGTGKLVQQVRANFSSLLVTAGLPIAWDNTVPTWDEGTEITPLNVTITPTSTSNVLVVQFFSFGGGGPATAVTAALFRDGTGTDPAIAANGQLSPASGVFDFRLSLVHYLTVPSIVAQTYSIRIGTNNGTSVYVNGGSDGLQKYGGVASSTMIVSEIKL